MKSFIALLLIALLAGCAQRTPPPVGLAEWSDVRRAADELILEAKPKAMLQSAETSDVSKELSSAFAKQIQGWSKAPLRNHHTWTKEVSPEEHQALQIALRKDWPAALRDMQAKSQWNHPPDRIIVYHFSTGEGKDEISRTFHVGAFQQDELWYFSLRVK